jgi:hypothetical protein
MYPFAHLNVPTAFAEGAVSTGAVTPSDVTLDYGVSQVFRPDFWVADQLGYLPEFSQLELDSKEELPLLDVYGKERVDSTLFDTQWSTDLTLPCQQLEMHLEDKYIETETLPFVELWDFTPSTTQEGTTWQELIFFEDSKLYHGTHGDTKGYF